MAFGEKDYVTQKEIENSYQFKLIKRVLKSEYDWIIDVLVPDDDKINKYSIIFLDIVINPFILQREIKLPFEPYMKRYFDYQKVNSPTYTTSFFQTMFHGFENSELKSINDSLEKTMRMVASSPSIPEELKLNKKRTYSPGTYIVPYLDVPEDIVYKQRYY